MSKGMKPPAGSAGDGDDIVARQAARYGLNAYQTLNLRMLVDEDESMKTIAHALGRHVGTVKGMAQRLFRKFGVRSRVGLTRRVFGGDASNGHAE